MLNTMLEFIACMMNYSSPGIPVKRSLLSSESVLFLSQVPYVKNSYKKVLDTYCLPHPLPPKTQTAYLPVLCLPCFLNHPYQRLYQNIIVKQESASTACSIRHSVQAMPSGRDCCSICTTFTIRIIIIGNIIAIIAKKKQSNTNNLKTLAEDLKM